MPELPEVETTRKGLQPHIEGQLIQNVTVRQDQLRWSIPKDLAKQITNQTIDTISRRGKYLLIQTSNGTLILHLGMSGCLRIVDPKTPVGKHDHVDILLANNSVIRFTDPRRFGALLLTKEDVTQHKLLINLGPEPLSSQFDVDYLFSKSRKRKMPIKTFIMDSKVVVGVGNIYANEALFMAGIKPDREAGSVSKARITKLVAATKEILTYAIKRGGTTLRDFLSSDGKPGYFQQELAVYGRANQPCKKCSVNLIEVRMNNRSTVFCNKCQR